MQTLDGELRGQLIIASLMSISHRVLPAALVVFRRQHPKMYIQIRDGLASNVQEDVRGGIADFGIGSAVGLPESVVAESITQEACYALLPRRHRLSRRSYIRLKDVTDEPMISMPTDSALRRTIDTVASAQGVALNHSIVTNQFTSLFDFVAAGLGIAIVPAAVIPPAKEFSIVVRPLRPTMTRRIGILHLADRSLSLASQAFLDIFRPAFVTATRQQEGRK
jgi:LysR family carnitine catabolism transcriptional activator